MKTEEESFLHLEIDASSMLTQQVDNLIQLGFHAAMPAESYRKLFDKTPVVHTKPFTYEDMKHLLLVVTSPKHEEQAAMLDINTSDGKQRKEMHLRAHPSAFKPYMIAAQRGKNFEDPRIFTTGIEQKMKLWQRADKIIPGNIGMIEAALEQQQKRGATLYELLAYIREHGSSMTEGQRVIAIRYPYDTISSDFPAIVKNEGKLSLTSVPDITVPGSMAEILIVK